MHGCVLFCVTPDCLAVGIFLVGSVLALPLEHRGTDEPVTVLETLGMALVERHQREDVSGPFDETGVPDRRREFQDDEPKIEATRMNQDALQDVRVTTQMRATHPPGDVDVGEGAFDILAASTQQPASSLSANPPSIAIHRRLGLRLLGPVATTASRLGHVGADADGAAG